MKSYLDRFLLMMSEWSVTYSTFFFKRAILKNKKRILKIESEMLKSDIEINKNEREMSAILNSMKKTIYYFRRNSNKNTGYVVQNKKEMKEWVRKKKL